MEHTQIVTAAELENYANTIESEAAVPELIWMLVKEFSTDLTTCRIPYFCARTWFCTPEGFMGS